MDFFMVHMPISGVTVFWPGLVVLGVGVGVIGGFFGMGGAWMVTPGLNILGFPMAFAIGTDIAHMAGKSIVSTLRHGRFGNIDYRLGWIMVIGTVAGLEVGAQMVMWLERIGSVETTVRVLYLLLLSFIAWLVFYDVYQKRRKEAAARASGQDISEIAGLEWYKWFHAIQVPPIVRFPVAGITCSAWIPIGVSFGTGWLAGILGIGGGLIRMPALIYVIGCPTHVAVGTDLFEVMISGLYGAATYTYKGRTELVAAMIMLFGAAIGAQIGTIATKYIHGYTIRIAFGCAVVACAVSVALKLAASKIPDIKVLCDQLSTAVVLGAVSTLSLYILVRMVAGVRKEALERASAEARR